MVSKADTNLYEKLNKALTLGKPVLWYEDENTCYYIDTISKSGTDIILTKGGKTITIESDGDITESGDVSNVLTDLVYNEDTGNIDTTKPIVETMTGYSFTKSQTDANGEFSYVYAGVCKNGNKLTVVVALNYKKLQNTSNITIGLFNIPSNIASKLSPTLIGGYNFLAKQKIYAIDEDNTMTLVDIDIYKGTNNIEIVLSKSNDLIVNKDNYIRVEQTFLLSDNLANE